MAAGKIALMEVSEEHNEVPPGKTAQEPIEDLQESQSEELEQRIAELEEHLGQSRDEMLRAIADLQNFRRRTQQDISLARDAAAGALAERLLPVLDAFERAIAAADAGASRESIVDGLRLVDRQLRDALRAAHVQPIEALGQPFDPAKHEAIGTVESDADEGLVVEEVETGYMLGKRVLRPTKARVSKRSS
jgi:molecular chaperone GrpE